MSNHLKNWWLRRKTKHYLKNNWHLLVDIILILLILGLAINIIIIKTVKLSIDTTPIKHIPKILIGTSTDYLAIETEIEKTNIYPNQEFVLHLNLENKGVSDISNINLIPTFSNNSFSVSKIKNKSEIPGLQIKGSKIILEKLNADEEVDVDLLVTLNIKKDSPRLVNWFLRTSYLENNKSYSKNNNLDSLKIITNLKVEANAYYHSKQGDQLGSGPIPPLVNLPTNYWVFFEVNNQGNDLSNLTVSARLPEGVTLTSSKTLSAGDFTYDEGQKRITWTVKKAAINNGDYHAGFEIQLLPTEKQIGFEPLLLTNISYIATDSYTGEKLSGRLSNINTNLPLDDINHGQGKVLE